MPQKILSLIIPKAQNSAKRFLVPTGLAMGIGENLGQIDCRRRGVTGAAMNPHKSLQKEEKAFGREGVATSIRTYGQGYGQGKESALG